MKKIVLVIASLVGIAAIGWFGVLPRLRPHTFHGSIIQSTAAAPSVDLIAHTGERMSLEDFEGKIVVMYFGYTYCPDVCPTTLTRLDEALSLMGDDADKVQVVMVSVDPERDSPEVLARYVPAFNDEFIGLTGTREEVAQLATVYGVYFEKTDVEGEAGYLVDHTATLMVVDEEGYLKLVLPFDVTADQIADDLSYLAG